MANEWAYIQGIQSALGAGASNPPVIRSASMAEPKRLVAAYKRKIVAVQSWVGNPRLRWRGEIIDGRIRTVAWRELEFPSEPPTYEAPTVRHAARALFYSKHVDRIARLFPELELQDADTASGVLMVPKAEVKPVLLAYRSLAPGPGIAAARRRRKMPALRLQKLVGIVRRAQEEGRKEMALSELEELLAPWL